MPTISKKAFYSCTALLSLVLTHKYPFHITLGRTVGNRWNRSRKQVRTQSGAGGGGVCTHKWAGKSSSTHNSKSITERKTCEEGWTETKEHCTVQTRVRGLSDCPSTSSAYRKCQENAFWAEARMHFPCSFCHWPLYREYKVC